MKKQLISALIPAYNEEECLHELYKRVSDVLSKLEKYDYEILIINDGSKDKTLEILHDLNTKDKHLQYVNLARNYGKEIAMAAGLDYVKGDVVVILDADLQIPPEYIPEMLSYYEEGYDDVYGRRKSRNDESFFKRLGTKIYYKALQSLTRVDILKNTLKKKKMSVVNFLKAFPRKKRIDIVDILRGALPMPLDYKELSAIGKVASLDKAKIYSIWEGRLRQVLESNGMNIYSNSELVNAMLECAKKHVD